METLLLILSATLLVSLMSLIGVISLAVSEAVLARILIVLVGFSAGALMAGAFVHLLPEAIEQSHHTSVFLIVLLGFTIFFLTEKFLYWRHCHIGKCEVHTFSYMILLGDGIHNFIDGLVIAVSFLVSSSFGILTTFMILIHEIPQEIGDFGVLVYGGFTRKRALMFNFLSALTAVLGALSGYFLSAYSEGITPFMLPFAAGGFLYIAASDLVPELHREADLKRSVSSFAFFLAGIFSMWLFKTVFG